MTQLSLPTAATNISLDGYNMNGAGIMRANYSAVLEYATAIQLDHSSQYSRRTCIVIAPEKKSCLTTVPGRDVQVEKGDEISGK